MWFKTQHLGTDYIRIAMDVHRDQIGEIIRAIASTQADQEAIADEDACRRVDAEDDTELDCEGPGAEGVDGGEDR